MLFYFFCLLIVHVFFSALCILLDVYGCRYSLRCLFCIFFMCEHMHVYQEWNEAGHNALGGAYENQKKKKEEE